MYLIVGLGNPGTQYSNTHHNAGFMAVEKLADPSKDWKSEHKALTMKVNIAGEECLLVKPQTYMNLSGEAVQALMTWYKVKVDHLLVFSDDINLDVGRIRCRKDGSHDLTSATGSWRSSRPRTARNSMRRLQRSLLLWNAILNSASKSVWNATTESSSDITH